MEGESGNAPERNFLDLLEFDSIGSWADEVDADYNGQCEAESQSAEAIEFNPKYAYQAQKLKESLPPSTSVEPNTRGEQHDHPNRGKKRSHGTSKYEWRSYSNQSQDDTRHSKYRNYHRRSGSSPGHRHDNGYNSPRPSGTRYSRDRAGLSPLRSPLASRPRSAEHDRRSSYRRQKPGESHSKSRVLSGINEHSDNTNETNGTPPQSQMVLSEEEDGGTPILSRWHMKDPVHARSRRRLSLPNDMQENEGQKQVNEIVEDDDERLARREKDIVYGKKTASYQKYVEFVSPESRNEDSKIHPRTPLKTRKCSRRSWDSQVRIWKRRIHAWAADTTEFLSSQETRAPVSEGPRWADVVAGTSALKDHASDNNKETETSSVDPSIDEDESFLAGFELDCNGIVDQMNDSIKLDDATMAENGL